VSIELRVKQAKRFLSKQNSDSRVIPIDMGIGLWKSDISNIWESEIRGFPSILGVRLRESDLMLEVTRG